MANYNGSLEAVDCDFYSVRNDMAVNRDSVGHPDASSGHLRRCSDAHTSNQCLSREKDASILSWLTLIHQYKVLIATFIELDMICLHNIP
eukprot:scaffold9921_cov79-Skeletonema_dohrnii-CCMP3373.AAC.4